MNTVAAAPMPAAVSTPEAEAQFQQLMTRPDLSWPTLALFVFSLGTFVGASVLALQGTLSIAAAMALNTLASYVSYTSLHEASHGLVSKHRGFNDLVGRISLLMVSLIPFFGTYRFLHMTHHRFTNDPKKDPDYFCGAGPAWALPLRWMVMDTAYISTYFQPGFYPARPRGEKIEFWLAVAFAIAVVTTLAVTGGLWQFLLLYFIPTRLALFALAITFDWLPHYPHNIRAEQNRYRATNNRIGLEWFFTPLFIGHNYHLAHHLYPTAPFYRYQKIWNARKALHDANDPALVPGLGLKPLPPRQAANATNFASAQDN